MKIKQAYLEFLSLVSRNATNNNLSVDKARFILNFNSTSKKYVEWILEKRNEDKIRYISNLLVLDKPLSKSSVSVTNQKFKLPDNYFDLANLSVFATKGKCSLQRLYTFEAKSEDIEELYSDTSQEPSFEWRETFYLIADGSVSVYKKDFKVEEAKLSYYRYPKEVDIEGYIKSDKTQSQDIDPEFDDKVVIRILTAMSKEYAANNGDGNKYQIDSNRLFSEI